MKLETPRAEKESAHEEVESRVGKLARAALVGVALSVGSAPSAESAGPLESSRVEMNAEGMRKYTLSSEDGERVTIELPANPLTAENVIIDGEARRVVRIAIDRSPGSVVRLILEDGHIIVDRSRKNVRLDYSRKKAGCDPIHGSECFDEFELEIQSPKL